MKKAEEERNPRGIRMLGKQPHLGGIKMWPRWMPCLINIMKTQGILSRRNFIENVVDRVYIVDKMSKNNLRNVGLDNLKCLRITLRGLSF